MSIFTPPNINQISGLASTLSGLTTSLANKQPLNSILTALSSLSSQGILAFNGSGFNSSTIIGTIGTIAVTNGSGVSGNPTLTIDPNYIGQASITTLGTVSTGIWSGTNIALNKGGTNANLTANAGSIIYSTASALALSAVGTSNQVLTSTGTTAPSWSSASNGISISSNLISAKITSSSTGFDGSGNIIVNSTATTGQILRSVGTLGAEATWGALDLSNANSIANNLILANGGTNASLTANAGAVIYSTASALALSSVGAANQVYTSTGTTAPIWTSFSSTNTASNLVQRDSSGNFSASTITASLTGAASLNVLKAGDTMTGFLTLSADPTTGLHAATKQYVDNNIQGITAKFSARAGTTTTLPTYTYNNGTSGVGATITATTNAALTAQDGVTLILNDNLLVKNESGANQPFNGLYKLTQVGSGSLPYVLTRAVDMDISAQVPGAFTFISEGSTLQGTGWVANPGASYVIGTTNLPFVQFSAAGVPTAGNGISIIGQVISAKITSSSTGFDGSSNIIVRSTSTTGQVLRSTGTSGNEATWGALDLSNSNAITNLLALTNVNISGGTAGAPSNVTDLIPYYNGTSTSNKVMTLTQLAANTAFTGTYLPLSGGTLTGAITFNVAGPQLTTALGTNFSFIPGTATTVTSAGNTLTLTGGPGGGTSGNGGALNINGGVPTVGTGGIVNITGANGVGTNQNGGGIVLISGNPTGTGTPGNISLTAGALQGAGTAGIISLTGGAGNSSTTGGAINITSGSGGGTGVGANVVITGGPGGSTSGNAGNVNILGGVPTVGTGGAINITGANGVGTNQNGGNLVLTAGSKTGSGTAGNIQLATQTGTLITLNTVINTAVPILMPDGSAANASYSFTNDVGMGIYRAGSGLLGLATSGVTNFTFALGTLTGIGNNLSLIAGTAATTSSAGYSVTIQGGPGGSSSGTGGALSILGGTPVSGAGGAINITGANGVGTNQNGGNITIMGSNPTGTGTPGNISLTAGALQGAGTPATVALIGGAGNSATTGGAVNLTGGSGGGTGVGANVVITGGPGGSTSGNAGNVNIIAGTPVAGNGGNVSISGSAGVGTTKNGGNVVITSGASTSGGTQGNIQFATTNGIQAEVIDNGATAVNFFTLKGSATTVATNLSVSGTDSNIGINVTTKGTGRIQIPTIMVSINALGNATGAVTLDTSVSEYVTATTTGATTWTFSNAASTGNAHGFVLELTNGGSQTQTWPAGTKWPAGTAPTLTTSGVDILVFFTRDGGTTWRGQAPEIGSA